MPPLEFKCGGTLVAPAWVLTLGQCTIFKNVSYWVRAGSDKVFEDGLSMHVESIHRLSKQVFLDPGDMVQDLALLKLDRGLRWSFIEPVKLPNNTDFLSFGTKVNVTGWGLPGGPIETFPSPLPFRTIPMTTVKFEEFMIFPFVYITLSNTTNLELLLYEAYGNGACFGDTGGPVVRHGVLYGIILPGHICGLNQLYGTVMTKITTHVNWIKSVIDDNSTSFDHIDPEDFKNNQTRS